MHSVLVVVDDERDRALLRRALSGDSPEAAEILEVADASAALQALEARPFDCLLLDLRLPDQGGRWLLEQMRTRSFAAPVVVLADNLDAQVAVDLMKAGATDYIPKSAVDPQRLGLRVQQAIRIGRAEAEARQARESQRHTEDLLRLIVDGVPALISYIDRDLRYRWLNQRYSEWFGVAPQQVGLAVEEVLGPAVFREIKPYLDRALAGEVVSYQRELPYRRGPRLVEASYVPHLSPTGEALGLVVLVQDVTERRTEDERRRRQLEFEQQLLGIVSHDLRNPITVISMNAATLMRREDTSPVATKALARILASADRASRMVMDLLDFTQARLAGGIPIHRRPVDFVAVTRQALDELESSFPEREISFAHQGPSEGRWDPDRLEQIIANLVTNALAYSAESTSVGVTSRGDDRTVTLEVHNQGDPIPPEIMPSLFEPFRRGRDRQGDQRSIGLGLYIVKHLVDTHGGTVEVRSTAADGTTFRVELPR